MPAIHGVELLDNRTHLDARGALGVFEAERLPFPLERVFFMHVDDAEAVRGGHANSCHELIVALEGAVTVGLDNGVEQGHLRLTSYREALWVRPGILIRLSRFAPGTTLLVLASHAYRDTRHYDRAQPHLLRQSLPRLACPA